MKLLSSKLPKTTRSAVRFTVVGTTGMFIQDGLYRLFLLIFRHFFPEVDGLTSVAFTVGFLLEMVSNYLLTTYYTFESRPDWKNVGGFVFARALNYVVQLAFLYLIIHMGVDELHAGFPSIFLAGVVNFFVTRLFFKNNKS